MRRDKNDVLWQEAKAKVRKRDHDCRLLRILSPQEFLILRKNAGSLIEILDPAHYRAASEMPEEIYNTDNICILNRFSHDNLDNCRNPISGKPITKEEREAWWDRILRGNLNQYESLKRNNMLH